MKKETNILITSVGRRTQLLKYFKKELQGVGNLVAVDCSNLAPALYIADKHYVVPRIDDPNYINTIKEICLKENISGIFSLIDPELSILAKHTQDFKAIGVTTVGSSYDVCELWLDKYSASKFYKRNGNRFAKTYNKFVDFENALKNGEIDFPIFIKPQRGSASLNVNKVNNMEQARVIFDSSDDMVIQEFLNGQELGIDVYIDMISNEVVSIFAKEKTSMRAGETDKAKSIKSDMLFEVIEELVIEAGLIGPIDIDAFEVDGQYYISEINPRFGGGYPLAYECGANFPRFIIKNLQGIINKSEIGNYEEDIYMMKHDSLMIKKGL